MPEPGDIVIECRALGVCYRRYRRKALTLKQAVLSLFRANAFEQYWAVRNLNVTIRRGESLGIIGPNGSGKSTLLKAIAGVLPPSEGELWTAGRIAPLIELGGGFNPELTGRENIFLNGAIMGMSHREMEQRLDRIIEFADVGDFIDAPLVTYSSGMRGRLGFAVATDVDPDILLLDEVFAVGDEAFRAKATERTEAFFRSNKTVVTVSHNLDLIRRLCDRAICLFRGRLIADDEPGQVIEVYREEIARTKRTLAQAV